MRHEKDTLDSVQTPHQPNANCVEETPGVTQEIFFVAGTAAEFERVLGIFSGARATSWEGERALRRTVWDVLITAEGLIRFTGRVIQKGEHSPSANPKWELQPWDLREANRGNVANRWDAVINRIRLKASRFGRSMQGGSK